MSDIFTVEIISPDQTILKQEANEVTIPSYEGQMGILNNHIPLITFLRPGIITIKTKVEKKFYVEEGTVEFSDNNLLILSASAKNIKKIDKSEISNMIIDSEQKVSSEEITDKQKYILSYKIDTLKSINQNNS